MKIGNAFILGFHGYTVPKWLEDFESRFGLGGVILFDYSVLDKKYENNIQNPTQLKRLTTRIHAFASRPFVMIDQEGGKVRRLKHDKGFQNFPSALNFGKLSKTARQAVCNSSFRELRELGIDYNLAPVIDLNYNPENPDIGKVERSFSANPAEVRENVKIIAGVAKEFGLKLCLKHFPGVGGATKNSHEDIVDLSTSLTEEQENLFYELGRQVPGETILVSHGIVNQWEAGVPMTISKKGIARLRAKLPDALLISDDIQMQGLQKKGKSKDTALLGLQAGLDMILIGNNMINEAADCFGIALEVEKLAATDPKFREALGDSERRVMKRKV